MGEETGESLAGAFFIGIRKRHFSCYLHKYNLSNALF